MSILTAVILWFNLLVVTEHRTVPKYESISVGGPIQVFLIKGLGDQVRIVADKGLSPFIKTEVQGTNLVIDATRPIVHERVLKVYASLEWVKKIHLSGASTLDVVDKVDADIVLVILDGSSEGRIMVDCKLLDIKMHNAANIFLAGSADLLKITLTGVSNIVADNLFSDNCKLTIVAPKQSPGVFRIDVSDTLWLKMRGSSGRIVRYKGDPIVIKDIEGFIFSRYWHPVQKYCWQ
ncbi:MAG: DUF2807 domain-containing protein [Bacteroidota bacterium]|nr:DUF2807 domain-containing protein [Bacteroidota bacterium]